MWTNFEHEIWKKLKFFSLENQNEFILSISGGLDSMALLKVMLNLKPKAKFFVAYFHHGDTENHQIQNFRDNCHELIQQTVTVYKINYDVNYITEKSKEVLKSEDDFRAARFRFLNQIQNKHPQALLLTGHHQDDLLETWLLKMIRGVGPQGIESFKFWNGKILRPLLGFAKKEVSDFAKHNDLKWCDDPTNSENLYLRNWIRNQWLPLLEDKIPGSVANLTLSLSRVFENINASDHILDVNYEADKTKAQFSRSEFLSLSHSNQLKALARILRQLEVVFSQGQLEEIIKRLDKNQKDLTFSIADVYWFINAQHVVIQLSL